MKRFLTYFVSVLVIAISFSIAAKAQSETWIYQEWKNDAWVDVEKYILTYTPDKKPSNYESFKLVDGKWIPDSRYAWEYNTNGNLVLFKSESFSTGEWVTTYKVETKHDELGNEIETITYLTQDGELKPRHKTQSTYEGTNIIETISFFNEDGEWQVSMKYSYTYEKNTRTEVGQYVLEGEEYMNSTKTVIQYDDNGNELFEFEFNWDYMAEAWKENTKTSYEYNDKGLLTTTISESFQNGEWMKSYKNEISYNENGDPVEEIFYNANEDGEWVYDSKTLTNYENGEIIEYIDQNYEDGEWVNNTRNYRIGAVSVDEVANNIQLTTYPNPSSDFLNIDMLVTNLGNLKIQVISQSGQYIATVCDETAELGTKQFKVNLNNYSSGTYYLVINNGKNNSIRKFVVVK